MQTEWRRESLDLAQEIKRHDEARGISASQFAVAWVLNNALVTGIIAGPRKFEQWNTTSAHSSTSSPPKTRHWSTGWWHPATPQPPATTIPPTPRGPRPAQRLTC
jgi:aryl-alcohol dehydrogenase-like predicted oxidoreductase